MMPGSRLLRLRNVLVLKRQSYQDIEPPIALANRSKNLIRSAAFGAQTRHQNVRVKHHFVDRNFSRTSIWLSLPTRAVPAIWQNYADSK